MDSIKGLIVAAILIAVIIVGGIFLYARPKATQNNATPTVTQSANQQTQTAQDVQEISLTKTGFSPATITVKTGTRVRWINNSGSLAAVDSDPHPVHTSYPPMNFPPFSNGSSVELVFPQPGTYHYHNHLNPSQTGTIIVQ